MERNLRSKNSIWKINKQMLPYKVHFFLYIGAMGALLPYYPSIGITRLRMDAGNLAVVSTIQQFLILVFKPLIGYAVDYFNNLKEMIVILTVIIVISSYLLLAIPIIKDHNFININDVNQSQKETASAVFCKFCLISSELNSTVKHLPNATKELQDGILCALENNVHKSAVGYCPTNLNSSVTLEIKLAEQIHTCFDSKSNLKQFENVNVNSIRNNSLIIFIKLHQDSISPELNIVCTYITNIPEFQSPNFTLNDIVKNCFKYEHNKIISYNITTETLVNISNRIVCNETEINKEVVIPEFNSFNRYQFWLFILFLLIYRTCDSTIFTLSDTACYEAAHSANSDYGKQRAWGAIGWGLIAPFSGFLNDYTDDYWAAVILMSFLCALLIWNLTKINLVKPEYSKTILKDVISILNSGEIIAFEIGIFLNGMGLGIVFQFLAWFITDIGGSRLLIGLANTVQCFLGEMPFMFLSGWLIQKIGHFNVVSMAMLAHAIRFLAYSSLKDPWMILPIECLDGITYGAFYAAMTSYAKKNSRPGTEVTTQSLLWSTCALGSGMGCLLGGACFDYFGGHTTFFYAGFCFVGASAINIFSTLLLHFRKRSARTSEESDSDDDTAE